MMKIIAAALVLFLMPGLAPPVAYLNVVSAVPFPSKEDNYKTIPGYLKNIARFPSASSLRSPENPITTPVALNKGPRYLAPTISSSARRSPAAIASGVGAARVSRRTEGARAVASIGAMTAEGAAASRPLASVASQSVATSAVTRPTRAKPGSATSPSAAVKKAADGVAGKASSSAIRGTSRPARPRPASKLKAEVAKRRAFGNYGTG